MRARWLKPEFFTDKKVTTLSPESALVYQALWCWADDGGVCICDPDYLKSQAFYRWGSFTKDVISKALRDLYDLKVIIVYKIGDDYYASIRHWTRHQKVHKPAKFRHPRPEEQLSFANSAFPPDMPGPRPGDSQASPPSRHLDTKTPRQLDVDVADGDSRGTPGGMSRKPDTDVTDDNNRSALEFSIGSALRKVEDRLETDGDREALSLILTAVPEPASWLAEARASLEGMHGPPLSPKQLGEALREYVGNGNLKTPNFKHFRRYLETAAKAPGSTNGDGRSQVAIDRGPAAGTGEAGAILARIKTLREVSTPQAGGQVERIRLADVEAMGADVLSAYQSVGGADAILKTDPGKWGFLVRDFALALTYARQNPGGSTDG